jgi:glyoxylase-like metal-dependent hydrolase (beta-lactamase superfamily II)
MVNPAKLIASATRLWGDEMDRLWGEFRPVPQDALVVLRGGERISAGGRDFEVAYTPGHASHHISYFNAETGIAFVGDTARSVQPGAFIVPPTPPPDIDLEIWRDSLRRIMMAAGHFFVPIGPQQLPVGAHLTEMVSNLELTASLVKASLARAGTDEDREEWFADELRRELRRRMSESEARAYEVAGRFDLNWRGLARYWRKKGN